MNEQIPRPPEPSSRFGAESPPTSFGEGLKRYEQVVAEMETGELPLEEAVAAYQYATSLHRFCEERIRDAEQRIEMVSDNDALNDDAFERNADANRAPDRPHAPIRDNGSAKPIRPRPGEPARDAR